MKRVTAAAAAALAVNAALIAGIALIPGNALGSPGPAGSAATAPLPPPRDKAYPGLIRLEVDASDVDRRIVHVHETLTGIGSDAILLYPKWLPGTHAPEGPIDRLAGLKIAARGVPVAWTRDPLDVYAFHIRAAGSEPLDIDFDYLSPTSESVGALEMSRDILMVEWNELVLYPAGYFARQVPVQASLRLPRDWKFGSALETANATGENSAGMSTAGARTEFKTVSLETLIDSPIYAGRYSARVDLDPGGRVPVNLNLFADRPALLAMKPEQLAAYRNLVQQAYQLFGSQHYSHYDFLFSLSDQVQQQGLEHHQSSENGSDPESFTEWDKTAYDRDLLPHEFTHSWNGKFRRPADLWTSNYNVPMQNSLLWVYEGQTQYWGEVLAARAGLVTRQQALDELAQTAAYYQNEAGREWRPLQDTTNDEIMNPRRPLSWRTWQRYEDYYQEGRLIWLDVDTLLRERSGGKRSLDDFARAFFGIDDGSTTVVTYTLANVVKTLNDLVAYDWAAFLRARLDSAGKPAPLDGLARGGYRLVYSETPGELLVASDGQRKRVSLEFSLGVILDDKDGSVMRVAWGSPAFKAGLAESAQILAVNGTAFSGDLLKQAIQDAKQGGSIELVTKTGNRFRLLTVDYRGGLRYPHLERDTALPARIDDIFDARK